MGKAARIITYIYGSVAAGIVQPWVLCECAIGRLAVERIAKMGIRQRHVLMQRSKHLARVAWLTERLHEPLLALIRVEEYQKGPLQTNVPSIGIRTLRGE